MEEEKSGEQKAPSWKRSGTCASARRGVASLVIVTCKAHDGESFWKSCAWNSNASEVLIKEGLSFSCRNVKECFCADGCQVAMSLVEDLASVVRIGREKYSSFE